MESDVTGDGDVYLLAAAVRNRAGRIYPAGRPRERDYQPEKPVSAGKIVAID